MSGSGSSSTPGLTVSPANLAFGNVTLNTASTLPVTLTSTGTAPVTINSGTLSGTGFTMSGATFPVTLNPTQSVTLNVQFDPATAGAATGQVTIQSNSSTNGTAVVQLSGTGTTVSSPQSASPQLTIDPTSLGVWRCDGERGIDTACDADLHRDGAGHHQLGNTERGRIYGVGSHVAGHLESEPGVDSECAVRSDRGGSCDGSADYPEQLGDQRHSGC